MANERVIVGVDVGTTKICALIGEVDEENRLSVVGVGVSPAEGLRKGVVVDIDEAATSIKSALERTERSSGYKIGTALVGIAGGHITSQNSHGTVAISPHLHEVTQSDVDRAIEAARAVAVPHNREILHVIPREYIVDGEEGIKDPLGMSGYRLEVVTHIVTGAMASIHNLEKCVQRAGIEIDDMVLEPMASGEAVLSPAERDLGVALVDIGGGTTDVAIYVNGGIYHTGVIPLGGNHLTNDIAVGLRAPFNVAEEMKITYGSVLASKVKDDDMVEMVTFENASGEKVSRRFLCEILESRAREMMNLVAQEIKKSGYPGVLPAGVVLTGGSAQLNDLGEMARNLLQMPVRLGRPGHVTGLTEEISGPGYATSIGLLLWGLKNQDMVHTEARRPANGRSPGVLNRIFSIFRVFLPASQ
jgi:cell division protein FtsA